MYELSFLLFSTSKHKSIFFISHFQQTNKIVSFIKNDRIKDKNSTTKIFINVWFENKNEISVQFTQNYILLNN